MWMDVHSSGSTVKHLNVRDIYRIPLGLLPPLEEQERIAGVLGAFDDLIETNRRLIETLEGLVHGLFAQERFDDLADGVVGQAAVEGLDEVGGGRGVGDGCRASRAGDRHDDGAQRQLPRQHDLLRAHPVRVADLAEDAEPLADGASSAASAAQRTPRQERDAVLVAVAQFPVASRMPGGRTRSAR